jgi:hypothetical protein
MNGSTVVNEFSAGRQPIWLAAGLQVRVGRIHVPATERLAITLPDDIGGPNN